ncbi:MAG: tripartite tricarboxylate transporter substrate binding protein [Burkholderiales bacterium]
MTRIKATTRILGAAVVGCSVALAAAPGAARAQGAYPSGTIEMIVPFGAGGGTDTIARIFEVEFSKALGGKIIVRNIAGASGSVGAAATAKARPDGYTIGYLPIGPASIQPVLRPGTYGAESWEYVCRTADDPALLMVPAKSPINSPAELLRKDALVYGSPGPGSVPHLALAALVASAGVKATHIPYKGTAAAMNAMAGGEIEVFADVPSVVRSFEVKPIGVFAAARHPGFPNVPTLAESGHALEFSIWHGVFAPAGTPRAIVDKLVAACRTAVNSTAFAERLQAVGTTPAFLGAREFEAFYRKALAANEKVLKSAGMIK